MVKGTDNVKLKEKTIREEICARLTHGRELVIVQGPFKGKTWTCRKDMRRQIRTQNKED